MKTVFRIATACALALALSNVSPRTVSPVHAASKQYVCVACALPCDTLVFNAPGTCPQCGMALVEKGSAAPVGPARKKVAILLFNGAQIIDYTGPYEVFGAAGFDVYTVAATHHPITTAMGMTVVPAHAFADAPQPDVLVVPGGGVKATCDDPRTLQWIRDVTARDQHTLSVCNGAFILASAGLLDGLEATTTAHNIDPMRSQFPKVRVRDDQRVVDNGKMVTAGGLSAGIDGALHVVSTMLGEGTAQEVALSEEYDWHPGGGFLRASMADMQVPAIDFDSFGHWDWVSTKGTAEQWTMVLRGDSPLELPALEARIGAQFIEHGKWSRVGAATGRSPLTSAWTFTGRDHKPWTANLKVERAPGGDRHCLVTLLLVREEDRAATAQSAPSSR